MTLYDIIPTEIVPVDEEDLYGLSYRVKDISGREYFVGGKAVHFNLYGFCHVSSSEHGNDKGLCASKVLVASLLARQEEWETKTDVCRVLDADEADAVYKRLGVPNEPDEAMRIITSL